MTVGWLDLGQTPHVWLPSEKNKKQAAVSIPLSRPVAPRVAGWVGGRRADEPVFGRRWYWGKVKMLQADLAAAGIPYSTERGDLDFHALRTTGITLKSRVPKIAELQAIARHADVRTTRRYLDASQAEMRSVIDALSAAEEAVAASEPSGRPGAASPAEVGAVVRAVEGVEKRHRKWHPPVVFRRLSLSEADDGTAFAQPGRKRRNPLKNQGVSPGLAKADRGGPERGRRGSNPQPSDRQSDALTN